MKTDAEYKRAERERYRQKGLRPLTLWVKPENREAIRRYAEKLEKEKPSALMCAAPSVQTC